VDRFKFTTIAHGRLAICNPIGEATLDVCLELLASGPEDTVIDIGCGKGEALIRLAERHRAQGVGLDLNPEFLRRAEEEAAARVPGLVTFHLIDASQYPAKPEAYAAAICLGSTHAYPDVRSAFRSLSRLVRAGGRLLIGEGYWRREPDPGYLALLGAKREELYDHAGNVAIGLEAGLMPLFSRESTVHEWDAYEGLYARTMEEYLEAHPDDPDADALRLRLQTWQDGYRRWGRDTLGFGVYVFQK
jgi:ubiquinone/menaquinone biosynthesis C-methylase UbiE